MLYNRCTGIYKFGNKYLPSAHKTQVEFRSHFSGKKVHLMGWEIRYIYHVFILLIYSLDFYLLSAYTTPFF